ncbi:tripartite tricarboxylate transporter TctB family protein [Pararhodobacter sp.]|uniref:tripartite tricarboxylate transporter TctB family protein n=1 Tax=Pararhodobacter sp. TaxID=2127056 RepID=UPI002AFDF8D5|nr:tripartite tricarboxylate transporter TctB family protein [Pararhodobacter sp.]
MASNRRAEILGGLILLVIGLATVLYTRAHYPLGTLRQIGPGFVPTALGVLLVLLGGAIAWVARPRETRPMRGGMGNVAAIAGGVLAFAVLLERAGFVIAIAVTVLIVTLPWTDRGWLSRVIVAGVTIAFVWLVFYWGLDMQIRPFAF